MLVYVRLQLARVQMLVVVAPRLNKCLLVECACIDILQRACSVSMARWLVSIILVYITTYEQSRGDWACSRTGHQWLSLPRRAARRTTVVAMWAASHVGCSSVCWCDCKTMQNKPSSSRHCSGTNLDVQSMRRYLPIIMSCMRYSLLNKVYLVAFDEY